MTTATLEERVTRLRGIEFVDMCGDKNPIHRDGDIVQGMHLASFGVKQFDRTKPQTRDYKLSKLEIEFKGLARYDELLLFSTDISQKNDNSLEVKATGTKEDGKPFIEMRMLYADNLPDNRIQAVEHHDFIYKKTITEGDIEKFCRSINIDFDLFKVAYLKEMFVSTFVAGALCAMIEPSALPQGKKVIFAKQTFDFYGFPDYDFKEVSLFLKKRKDSEKITHIKEEGYIDDYKVIEGSSLLFKVDSLGM